MDQRSQRQVLRGWGLRRVKTAGVGKKPERCLCRTGVAEEVCEEDDRSRREERIWEA